MFNLRTSILHILWITYNLAYKPVAEGYKHWTPHNSLQTLSVMVTLWPFWCQGNYSYSCEVVTLNLGMNTKWKERIRNWVIKPREPIENATTGGIGPLNIDAACTTKKVYNLSSHFIQDQTRHQSQPQSLPNNTSSIQPSTIIVPWFLDLSIRISPSVSSLALSMRAFA